MFKKRPIDIPETASRIAHPLPRVVSRQLLIAHYPTAYGGHQSPDEEDAYHSQNPFMDSHHAGRTPSPGHPMMDQYALHDTHYTHDEPLQMPLGPGPGPGTPSDRLQPQPTVSTQLPQSYEAAEC